MPIHDWTTVEPGIFHAFHHQWISALNDILNNGVLPRDYYALPEQITAGFGPDVFTPSFTAMSEAEFYRRKKSAVAVKHVSGDRTVAILEIVSPGNKAGRKAFQAFVDKAWDLLEKRIHLLIVDLFPPGPRDPQGIHGAIWEEIEDDGFLLPDDKPLTLAAYECDEFITRAYIEPVAVGDVLPDMALFLQRDGCVYIPLEATYQTAFAVMPRRWQKVLQPEAPGKP